MTHDWLAVLRDSTERFASAARRSDPAAAVTYCPGWTVRDLVDHLGGVHQWAAHAVVAGDPRLVPEPVGPDDDLADWYAGHAGALLDVLSTTPPDAPAWTLDPDDRTAGFWRRRQVHETVMHTWDTEEALGEQQPIPAELAWDGVLEVVDVMYPRQVRLGRVEPLAHRLRLVATDLPGRVDLGAGDGEVVLVEASAEVLLRLLWNRVDPEREGVDPRAVLLLSGALTP